jgi:hypothetical protein
MFGIALTGAGRMELRNAELVSGWAVADKR